MNSIVLETLEDCRDLVEEIQFDTTLPFTLQFEAVFPPEQSVTHDEKLLHLILREMSLQRYYGNPIDIRNERHIAVVKHITTHIYQEVNN